jgi:hypothetical protein
MAREKYDHAEPAGWAEKVAQLGQTRLDSYTLVLHGPCPRCHDEMAVEIPLRKRTGSFDVTTFGPDSKPEIEKTARCNCKMKHDERPDDVTSGCGAFGLLEVWL